MPLRVHPYILRHACGFALGGLDPAARLIRGYLGDRDTVVYTATNPARFEKLWR
jgi:type 1 fimbriae regulatory protein FimB